MNATAESLPLIGASEPCSCERCQTMCRRPCWPVPSDVRALIEAGEGGKLMLDYWVGSFTSDHDNTYIVCPANSGHEGTAAPEEGSGFGFGFAFMCSTGSSPLHKGCVFQKDGLCTLHDRGLKPAEGKAAHHALKRPDLHEDVARHWDTEEGRAIVASWCALVGEYNPYQDDSK